MQRVSEKFVWVLFMHRKPLLVYCEWVFVDVWHRANLYISLSMEILSFTIITVNNEIIYNGTVTCLKHCLCCSCSAVMISSHFWKIFSPPVFPLHMAWNHHCRKKEHKWHLGQVTVTIIMVKLEIPMQGTSYKICSMPCIKNTLS